MRIQLGVGIHAKATPVEREPVDRDAAQATDQKGLPSEDQANHDLSVEEGEAEVNHAD